MASHLLKDRYAALDHHLKTNSETASRDEEGLAHTDDEALANTDDDGSAHNYDEASAYTGDDGSVHADSELQDDDEARSEGTEHDEMNGVPQIPELSVREQLVKASITHSLNHQTISDIAKIFVNKKFCFLLTVAQS